MMYPLIIHSIAEGGCGKIMKLPSDHLNGLLLKMAIEIVDLPIKNGGSFHSYVSLPEGTPMISHYTNISVG